MKSSFLKKWTYKVSDIDTESEFQLSSLGLLS